MERRLAIGLAALLALSMGQASADTLPPLTSEQSASLGRALLLWTRGFVGDASGFTATPADGYYAVEIPVAGEIAGLDLAIEGPSATARARLEPDGRWKFDAIALPSPLTTLGPAEAGGKRSRTIQTIRRQSGNALIDPTLKAASSGELTQEGIEQRTEGDGPATITTIARATSHEEWVPASPGRVDAALVGRADAVALHTEPQPGEANPPDAEAGPEVTMRAITLTSTSSDADPERLSRLFREAIRFAAGVGGDPDAGLTPAQRAALHKLLALTRDLARDARISVAVEGLTASAKGVRLGLDRVLLAERLAAPDGKLDLRLRMEAAGFDLGSLVPAAFREFVPRKLVFAPFVGGAPSRDVYEMLDRLIDDTTPSSDMADEAQARLARAPITTGIEELAFDVGPASVSGKGQMTAAGPDALDGTAVIEARGMDALIKRANANPMLKQGVPVLIFLKGIGEQDGDRLVWNVAYKGNELTVNGNDVSGMLPGK